MSKNQSSFVKNGTLTSEDLKTDSVPDTLRERDDDEENNESLSYPPKEEVAGEEIETGLDNKETYLSPQSHGTKKKSPKSMPKCSKNKKEKKQPSEPSTTVYKISHSNGVHIGPNMTIVHNSPSTRAQPAPDKNEIIRGLLDSKQQVTRDNIRLIAPHVGQNWKDVGRTLNLTDGRLEQIEQDHYKEGMKEVIYQILLEWLRANGSDARVGELTNALWTSREYSAVKKLEKWAKESSSF